MICQKCKNAVATVCISQVVNNHKTDIYLCQECANESAAAGLKAALGLMGVLPGHLFLGGSYAPYQSKPKADSQCPTCGKSFFEIQQDGKIGCANCYTVFLEKLKPMVAQMHGAALHKGTYPSAVTNSDEYKAEQEIVKLKAMLEHAIAEEAYEQAAELRDRIKGLEVKKGE